VGTILVLAIGTAAAYRVMTPDERLRFMRATVEWMRWAKEMAEGPERDPFRDALCERTSRAFVTPTIIALNAIVFFFMLLGAGAFSNPDTLVSWGGNFGPRTTNGEWWRLPMSMFVHGGPLQLVASIIGLAQIGLIVERLVGPLAFALVYLSSGILAGLVTLSGSPVGANVGAAGGIFGVYGVFVVSTIWGWVQRSTVSMPLKTLARIAPAAGVFLLYAMIADNIQQPAALAAFAAGAALGLALMKGVSESTPPLVRVGAALAVTTVIVVASAVPLRGIADVRPEIAHIVALEERTTHDYQSVTERFTNGRTTAEALARFIDSNIAPEMQAARARLAALAGVPRDHQALIATAAEYLRLRDESWRLRAEALHKSSEPILHHADVTEWKALELFKAIKGARGAL